MRVEFCLFSVQFAVILLIYSDVISPSTSVNLKELFTPENEELLLIMKEELEKFKIDMTKNFMQKHSRRKRALDGHVKDIDIKLNSGSLPITTDSVGPFSTFTFAGNPFLIKRNGIFQLDGLNTLLEAEGQVVSLVEKGSWNLAENEIVLNGFEWRRNFFLVTTTGTFSTIYTLHENSLKPVFRQNILNKANAVGAEFFQYRNNLYMIILNDNPMHTSTFSPMFRWAGSYMDVTHEVETTGACAVKTFQINSKKYIAIAQSRDSSGNTEVGTLVLSMDHMDRLERVQLLWSNGANDLHYMHTDKEHFIVIAQEKEPSIVYWFSGMDFFYWQQLDDLQGQNLVLEGVQLSSDDPILIASDGNLLKVFSRSASGTKIMTTWVKNEEINVFSSENSFRTKTDNMIMHLNLLKTSQNGDHKLFLVMTKKLPGSEKDTIQMYPVDSVQRPISVSLTKEPGDKLSLCMNSLRTKLKDSEETLNRIEEKSKKVLTVDGDWNFQGNLASTKVIKPANSQVKSAEISPAIQRAGSERFDTSPSVLLDNIKQSNSRLELMKTQLNDVVFKTTDNDITGDIQFLNDVQFSNFDAGDKTNLNVVAINDVTWEELDTFALRNSFEEPQEITAEWTVESIKASTFKIANENSKLSTENFMLKKCESSQTLSGPFQFNNALKMVEEVKLQPETTVNSIKFSDIVLQENENREIKGIKHAPFVTGSYSTDFVNNQNLQSWFASVAKISGTTEQRFTGPVEVMKGSTIKIDNAAVEVLNGKNWKEFGDTVMLNGVDQDVEGLFEVDTLKVDKLRSKSISGISTADLLTSNGNQHVTSNFNVENLEIKGPLSADLINGIQLTDAVNRHDSHVEIQGPVTIENFQVQDIFVPEGVLIADKDVSELANMKKVHEYSTVDGGPIFLNKVNTDSLTTSQIDEEQMDNFPSKYWSKTDNNVENVGELILDGRKVTVSKGNFKTQKLNRFSFPNEFVSLDEDQEEIVLRAPLRFNKPVTVSKDVSMAKGATVEGIDMSEVKSLIVDENFKGMVRGKKTFASSIKALQGAHIENLNGIDPVEDVVMLNSEKLQRIEGALSFEKMVKADHVKVDKGDVHVKGLVNEENLAEVKDTTVYKNKENRIEGDVVFTKGLQVNKFSTTMLNKLNVKEITDNMVFLDHPGVQTFDGHLILEDGGADFLKDSTVGTMNNVAVHDYLSKVIRLDSSVTSVISGTKTFKDAILADELMCTTFNGVDIKDLNENAFSRTKSQEITGEWSLNVADFKKNLEATKIGQVSVDNIVFTDEPIEVSSMVDFKSEQTSIEGPFTVDGHVNGVNFDEKMNDGVTIQGLQNFKEVNIEGNLDWKNDRPELQRLSYFFENAVTKSNPLQTILGTVAFRNGFQSEEINTPEDKWLSDINLRKIQSDAVTRDTPNLEISGHNTFTQPLSIQKSVAVNALNTDTINSVDLHKLDKDIVRKTDTSGRKITGVKVLRGNLQAENLKVKDKISDVSVNDLVVSNDPRAISQVHFENLQVDDNLDWESTSGIDLKSLLDDRVSLTKDNQNLEGTYTLDEVTVENESGCSMPLINDITVKNVVKKSNIKKLKKMSGQKVFTRPLVIKGALDTPTLNNHPVKDIVASTLHVDKPATISRPVIFKAPVVVNKQLKIESINDIHLEKFSSEVSQRIARLLDDAQSPGILSTELSSQAMKLQKISQERPVWMEYLRMKKDMTGLGVGAQSRVDQVQVTKSGDVRIVMHRDMDGEVKGLPKGCNCNSVVSFNLNNISGGSKRVKRSNVKSIGMDDCLNVFNVESPNKRSYSVIGETISSNTTCVTDTDSTTKIFRGERKISDTKMGHISDAGVFSEGQDDFLVLAQYFDKNTGSHSTVTRILRVDKDGKLESVQNIETHGARKVALNKVDGVWMLAIANSKNSADESSCNADSAIYQWSSEQTQFLLMRTIMTDGAFDVEFITTETSNEFYKQNFVAFAQQGDSASGEVMIFRYEQPEGNFKMAQTIRSKWPVTGLRTSYVCRQSFLVTVVPQDGITFYENRFVEGFQEYYKAPVFGATDISGFEMNGQHLYAIATNKGPVLAEAVIAGSCPT